MLKTYSTSRVARGARLRYWNDLHSSLAAPVEIRPLDRATFEASSVLDYLGQLRLVKTASTAASVEHQAKHVAETKEHRFRVVLCAEGRMTIRHAGREAALNEGDFALLDDLTPYRIAFAEPNQAICVAVEPGTLAAYLPSPARLCGLPMQGDRPLNRVVSSMLLGLWSEVENGLPVDHRPALEKSWLQVLAAAYAIAHSCDLDRSVVAAGRRAEIKQHIELHLRSSELTPTTIAAALGCSRRYLRWLFAAESDSLAAYIRRRRLEECAFELSQPLWQGRSITATAADWGFRSVAHFARAFRSQFGTTPTAYKQARLAERRLDETADGTLKLERVAH